MENNEILEIIEDTPSKQCLFVSSFLDFILEYCPIDLVSYPPIFANKQTYELLTPLYYAWLRSKIETVNKFIQSKRLNENQMKDAQESMAQFQKIHDFAVNNFTPESLENAIHELLRDPKIFITTAYNPEKDIHRVKLEPIDSPKTQLEPKLAIKPESLRVYYTTATSSYADELKKQGLPSSYFEFEKDTLSSRNSDNEKVSISSKDLPFSRLLPSSNEAQLSDLSNLSWLEIVSILRIIDKNTKGQNRQVNALLGYCQPIREDRPNIGMEIGLLKFLDNCREIIKGLIQQGLYSIKENKG